MDVNIFQAGFSVVFIIALVFFLVDWTLFITVRKIHDPVRYPQQN